MNEIRAALGRGDICAAARQFAELMGLPWTEHGPLTGTNPDTGLLHLALEQPLLDKVGWWRTLSEGWLHAGAVSLARACAEHARRLVERGTPCSWQDLQALARVAREAVVVGDSGPSRSSVTLTGGPHDARHNKADRLKLLFGQAEEAQMLGRLRHFHGQRDPLGVILSVTGSQRVDFDRFALVETWHQVGQDRAAVESFVESIAGRPLADWIENARNVLRLCGQSLCNLGDQVTAFACFRLAIAVAGPTTDNGTDESAFEKEQLRRLSWAESKLDSYEGLVSMVRGPRIAAWLTQQGLASRFPAYARRSPGLLRMYPPAVLIRQLRQLTERSAWFNSRATALELFGEDRGESRRLQPVRIPGPIPLERFPRRRTVPPGGTVVGDEATVHDPAGRYIARFMHESGISDAGVGAGAQVRVGLAESGSVTITVGSDAPVVALGVPAVDRLFRVVADGLAGSGRTILWFNAGRIDDEPHGDWLRLRGVGYVEDSNRRWLSDLASSDAMRSSLRAVLRRFLPPCDDPAVSACLDAVLTGAAQSDGWAALSEGSAARLDERAIQIVSATAGLSFCRPGDLRRAASLVGYVRRALEGLMASLRTEWSDPTDAEDDDTPRPVNRIMVELPGDDRLRDALLVLLVTGSLLRTSELCGRRPENAEDLLKEFDFNIRTRQPFEDDADEPASEHRSGQDDRSAGSPMSDLLMRFDSGWDANPWNDRSVLPAAGKQPTICVFLTGEWDDYWPLVAEWFQPGQLGQNHVLVAGSRTAPGAAFRRDVLGRCRCLFVGDLPDAARSLLQVATGIIVPPNDPPLGEDAALLIQLTGSTTTQTHIVLWPESSPER